MSIHIHPVAELAPRVLLPGEPGTAMAMAQTLLADGRLMFNHHHGLWGYSGVAADGEPLTIQSTGVGGPSAAIVMEELARLGAKTAIRVGTCGTIAPAIKLGELVVADEVIAADGASQSLGAPARAVLDRDLTTRLSETADHRGAVASHDLFYDPAFDANAEAWRSEGAVAVDLETAAIAAVAARSGIAFACLLVVSDVYEPRARICQEHLDAAAERLGRAAFSALATKAS